MKILMVAPEPFFQPRGTPFSVYHRLEALSKLGHQVDLVTYPLGKDVFIDQVEIYRSWKPPFVKGVKIGPSLLKPILDIFLFIKATALLMKKKYDCIHTHEEGTFLGAVLNRIFKYPHVYDMHSSLPEQFLNFGIIRSHRIIRYLELFERWALKYSSIVIAICPYLQEKIGRIMPDKKTVLIENIPNLTEDAFLGKDEEVKKLRKELSLEHQLVILYTGTLETYQGIDLLLESARYVTRHFKDVKFLLVGGTEDQMKTLLELADSLGVRESVLFTGQRPVEEMPSFIQLADILVSPRKTGTNTPLKIYTYLSSGKPIVATNLLTHTQALNPEVAILTEPNPEDFARGILKLIQDPSLRARLGQNALKLSKTKYSYQVYLSRTAEVYNYILMNSKR